MDDMPFGLARKDTYAELSAKDLESLGKEASSLYLDGGMSLNDAVVKVAGVHPSISPHQVRRVVEFANTETFQRIFEKQADDKNVDFDVADPGAVLRNLEMGSRGQISAPAPSEYSSEPVKLAHHVVEADIALCRMFGMEPVAPGMEKSAEAVPTVGPADRILMLKKAEVPPGMPLMAGPAPQAVGQTPEQIHLDQMLTMQRQIELEKKKQELASVQQKTMQLMQPQEEMMGQMGQAAPEASVQPPPEVAQAMQGPQMGGPPPAGGGPAGPPTGPIPEKLGSLMKEAMSYVKTGRKHFELVLDDLHDSTSLERIKIATADKNPEPEANPYGDLLRLRQTLTKMAEDAVESRDRNEMLLKDAAAQWIHQVSQYMADGGQIGEIAHIMGDINPRFAKTAMAVVLPRLREFGIKPETLTAQSLYYEMTKGASRRRLNPDSPIVQSYSAMAKLAEGQAILKEAARRLSEQLDETNAVLKEAMRASA